MLSCSESGRKEKPRKENTIWVQFKDNPNEFKVQKNVLFKEKEKMKNENKISITISWGSWIVVNGAK